MTNKTRMTALLLMLAITGILAAMDSKADMFGSVYADQMFKKDSDSTTTFGAEVGFSNPLADAFGFAEYTSETESLFLKGSSHVKLMSGFTVYGQVSHFTDPSFNETTAVVGGGYLMGGSSWSVKPFVGLAKMQNNFGMQDEMVMVGWTAFKSVTSNLSLSNWHETTFKHGTTANGAVSAFYDVTENVYVGATYRYYFDAAGVDGYGDAGYLRVGYKL